MSGAKRITFTDGDGEERTLVAVNELCWRCDGDGAVVNPSVDHDFIEGYFGGRYDVPCPECDGKKVVLVPDMERNPAWLLSLYEEHIFEEYQDRRMAETERMYCQ
jgi:hypothetical protein